MDMTGEVLIAAPREAVYAALNDPEILKQAIPGCEEIEKTSDTHMTAKVTAKVGPVKAKFSGEVTLSDLNPPQGYTISGSGKGGAAGHASGSAKVDLDEAEGGTLLRYEVNAKVGGKMAQLGGRLIDGTAKKMADQFFSAFQELVAQPTETEGTAEVSDEVTETPVAAGDAVETPAAAPSTAQPGQPEKKDRTLLYLALAGLIAVAILAMTL
ncbi:SRPBCC family protein [Rhodovibrionaceae bacterium A322]